MFYSWEDNTSNDPDWPARRRQKARVFCDGQELTHVTRCETGRRGRLERFCTVDGAVVTGHRRADGSPDIEVHKGKISVTFEK